MKFLLVVLLRLLFLANGVLHTIVPISVPFRDPGMGMKLVGAGCGVYKLPVWLASFPGLPHLQLLIASSMQKAGGAEGLGTSGHTC